MYTFEDKGGRSITLRPELTASMVRSYLENEMNKGTQPAKLWSIGRVPLRKAAEGALQAVRAA